MSDRETIEIPKSDETKKLKKDEVNKKSNKTLESERGCNCHTFRLELRSDHTSFVTEARRGSC